jgi:hypothetical protein
MHVKNKYHNKPQISIASAFASNKRHQYQKKENSESKIMLPSQRVAAHVVENFVQNVTSENPNKLQELAKIGHGKVV